MGPKIRLRSPVSLNRQVRYKIEYDLMRYACRRWLPSHWKYKVIEKVARWISPWRHMYKETTEDILRNHK